MAEVFSSEDELDAFMSRVRTASIPNDEFSHRFHLAMAAVIVFEGGGLDEIRSAILALNDANKVEQTLTGGYHETITVAWHRLVHSHLASLPTETPRILAVNSVLHEFQDKFVLLRHYSRDRLMSWEARKGFVEPDVSPLPGP